MSNHYSWTPREIQRVREEVRRRANYKCYFCNKDIRKTSLAWTIHHIISKSVLKDKCWEKEYLICICKDCHFKLEKLDKLKQELLSKIGDVQQTSEEKQ